MKFGFKGCEDFSVGIKRLSQILGFDIGDGDIEVSAVSSDRLGVTLSDKKAIIYYKNKHQFFRELGVLTENAKKADSLDIAEDSYFDAPGIMLDCSRGAVASVAGVKKFIDYIALMGYGMAMLYTEDTVELEGRPYFGYMRGRYTKEELTAIDDYAYDYGIEMIPCIECYGHMGKYLLWGEAASIKDTSEVLLAREDDTFLFLEEWIAKISSCFRSKKIHIGMDEAWDMGRGEFMNRHGYVPRFEIFSEYMERLVAITDKYGLSPMMWSDMYFRISSKSGKEYYDEDATVPEWVKERIPKNVTLVFWHYRGLPRVDEYMLKKHVELGCDVVHAGGLWGWSGHLPENELATLAAKRAVRACRDSGVPKIMTTIWSNDNAECDLFSQLIGLSYFIEHVYDPDPSEEKLKARFNVTTGGDYDAFYKMGSYHNVTEGKSFPDFQKRFIGKQLFWQDPLLGMYDANLFKEPMSAHYGELRDYFAGFSKADSEWRDLYTYAYEIFDYLCLKTHIAENLVPAYLENDTAKLKKIASELLPELIKKTETVHAHHKSRWRSYNKLVGWSCLDIRYAGIKERCKSAIEELFAFLDGRIDSVEELAVTRLPRPESAFTKYSAITSPMGIV